MPIRPPGDQPIGPPPRSQLLGTLFDPTAKRPPLLLPRGTPPVIKRTAQGVYKAFPHLIPADGDQLIRYAADLDLLRRLQALVDAEGLMTPDGKVHPAVAAIQKQRAQITSTERALGLSPSRRKEILAKSERPEAIPVAQSPDLPKLRIA